MTNPTSNFGWQMPTSTDLVTDLPADFEVFGQAVDTSLADLRGGTSGQVLAKNSNTDMDFVWVAQDDSNAIQNAIVDAKGDLITATAADVPARLASSGVNGEVLTVDTSTSTGLKWAAISAGGLTQLATGSLSSGTTTISAISGSYKHLQLIIRNFLPEDDGNYLRFRLNGQTGINTYASGSTVSSSNQTISASSIGPGSNQDNAVATGSFYLWDLYDYANTSTWKFGQLQIWENDAADAANYNFRKAQTLFNQTSAISSISIFAASGNITSGTYILYGVA